MTLLFKSGFFFCAFNSSIDNTYPHKMVVFISSLMACLLETRSLSQFPSVVHRYCQIFFVFLSKLWPQRISQERGSDRGGEFSGVGAELYWWRTLCCTGKTHLWLQVCPILMHTTEAVSASQSRWSAAWVMVMYGFVCIGPTGEDLLSHDQPSPAGRGGCGRWVTWGFWV